MSFEKEFRGAPFIKIVDTSTSIPFSIAGNANGYRVFLVSSGGYLSDNVLLDGTAVELTATAVSEAPDGVLGRRDAIKLRSGLSAISIVLPDGRELRNAGLRHFASVTEEFEITYDKVHKACCR